MRDESEWIPNCTAVLRIVASPRLGLTTIVDHACCVLRRLSVGIGMQFIRSPFSFLYEATP